MKALSFFIPITDVESKINSTDLIQLIKLLETTKPITIIPERVNENSQQLLRKVNHIEAQITFPLIVKQKLYTESSDFFLLTLINNALILFANKLFYYILPPPLQTHAVQITSSYLQKNKKQLHKQLNLDFVQSSQTFTLSPLGIIISSSSQIHIFDYKIDKNFQFISTVPNQLTEQINSLQLNNKQTETATLTTDSFTKITAFYGPKTIVLLVFELNFNTKKSNFFTKKITLRSSIEAVRMAISPSGQLFLLVNTSLICVNLTEKNSIQTVNLQFSANKTLSNLQKLNFQRFEFLSEFVILLFDQQICVVPQFGGSVIFVKSENYANLKMEFLGVDCRNFLVKSGKLAVQYFINQKRYNNDGVENFLHVLEGSEGEEFKKNVLAFLQFVDGFCPWFIGECRGGNPENGLVKIQNLILQYFLNSEASIGQFYSKMVFLRQIGTTQAGSYLNNKIIAYLLNQIQNQFDDNHFIDILSKYEEIKLLKVDVYVSALKRLVILTSLLNQQSVQKIGQDMNSLNLKLQLFLVSVILDLNVDNKQYFMNLYNILLDNFGILVKNFKTLPKLALTFLILLNRNIQIQENVVLTIKNVNKQNFIESLYQRYNYLLTQQVHVQIQLNYHNFDQIDVDRIIKGIVNNYTDVVREIVIFKKDKLISTNQSAEQLLYLFGICPLELEKFVLSKKFQLVLQSQNTTSLQLQEQIQLLLHSNIKEILQSIYLLIKQNKSYNLQQYLQLVQTKFSNKDLDFVLSQLSIQINSHMNLIFQDEQKSSLQNDSQLKQIQNQNQQPISKQIVDNMCTTFKQNEIQQNNTSNYRQNSMNTSYDTPKQFTRIKYNDILQKQQSQTLQQKIIMQNIIPSTFFIQNSQKQPSILQNINTNSYQQNNNSGIEYQPQISSLVAQKTTGYQSQNRVRSRTSMQDTQNNYHQQIQYVPQNELVVPQSYQHQPTNDRLTQKVLHNLEDRDKVKTIEQIQQSIQKISQLRDYDKYNNQEPQTKEINQPIIQQSYIYENKPVEVSPPQTNCYQLDQFLSQINQPQQNDINLPLIKAQPPQQQNYQIYQQHLISEPVNKNIPSINTDIFKQFDDFQQKTQQNQKELTKLSNNLKHMNNENNQKSSRQQSYQDDSFIFGQNVQEQQADSFLSVGQALDFIK